LRLNAKVDVILDPSFEDVVLPLKSEPFQLTRVGYATFQLNFTVYFQRHLKMKPLELYHDISFDPKGSHKVQTITL
jgi:transcription initiation factor IIF auxiliary subunit